MHARAVAAAAGADIAEIVNRGDRAYATEILSKGMEILVPQLYEEGRFDGILSFGGSGGTALVTPAMRAQADQIVVVARFSFTRDQVLQANVQANER